MSELEEEPQHILVLGQRTPSGTAGGEELAPGAGWIPLGILVTECYRNLCVCVCVSSHVHVCASPEGPSLFLLA